MKKFLLLAVCCLCLCGCENKNFTASKFEWNNLGNLHYASGSIKNNSRQECSHFHIRLIYKSENLKEEASCYSYFNLAPGKSTNIECLYTGDLYNIQNYEINIKSIECQDYLYN